MSSEIKPNHSLSPESGEMEFTEAAEAKMRIGDKVKVLRSSGEIEEDWTSYFTTPYLLRRADANKWKTYSD